MKTLYKSAPLLVTTALVIASCTGSGRKSASPLVEKQLGSSKFYLSLPENYRIKQTDGPDFSVYHFRPADSTEDGIGSGGLYVGGHPGLFGPDTATCASRTNAGLVLQQHVEWRLYDCGDKFSAETLVRLDRYTRLHAFVEAESASGRDSLIRLFARLNQKGGE